MLIRITHYFTALILLSGLAVVYQNLIAPFMQAPRVTAIAMAKRSILRGDPSLKDLFADGSWQRGSCKQLQTSDGMLLFQNWEQSENDQWKLWPVTVVIGRGMSGTPSDAPVIIDAVEGAEIEFTESLDVMSGGAPPIKRGKMIGKVNIYRSSDDEQGYSLDLQTANVGIDKRKIWTTEAIKMKVGQARLVGRDLTIHLSGATGGGGASAILERMELIYLDELVMPLTNGGLKKPNVAKEDEVAEQIPAMISIHCGGRVEYDFALDQLLLLDSVSLVHQKPGAQPDRFDCDSLELILNDPTNGFIERSGPMDWLVEIVATGSPAIARLPSYDAELAADRIEFNAIDGLIRANGRKGIRVRKGGVTARLAQLVYQFDPTYPEALGTIDARGAGIVQINDPSIPLRKAQWRDRFLLQPVDVTTAKDMNTDMNIQVDGQFHAWLTDGGEFKADAILGVLTPQPRKNSDSGSSLAPDRFVVTGNVRIDTSAIAVETDYLFLDFVAEENPRQLSEAGDQSGSTSPLRQWVQQPREEGTMVDPVARHRPTIRGNRIIAKLRRNDSGLSAKKLSVTGSVEVIHQLETGGQSLPARLTGEYLQLIDGGGEDVLELGGSVDSPARLDLGDGFFVGPKIQIRPRDNYVWINSAGEFQMPTAMLPTGLSSESSSNASWIRPPHCRWLGEMHFNGRTAVLSGGVDITAALVNRREPWELHMTGDQLQIDLVEAVQLSDLQTMRSATVQRVSLTQASNRPVMVQAIRRAADGVQEAKHLIHAAMLSLTPSDGGKIVGDGPGWYRGWMIPPKDDSLMDAENAALIDGADKELTGIHLIFNDSMQADMAGRNLDFLRGVRVGVRSVSGWDEAFDAKMMDAISMGDSTLDCDRLRFTVEPGYDTSRRTAGAATPWEMEATSGVVFRTRSERGLLEGTASRAAYASSKDLFTAEGAPNRAAIVRQTLPDGSAGPEGEFRSISIHPKSMTIENAVIQRLNIATPPSNLNR